MNDAHGEVGRAPYDLAGLRSRTFFSVMKEPSLP